MYWRYIDILEVPQDIVIQPSKCQTLLDFYHREDIARLSQWVKHDCFYLLNYCFYRIINNMTVICPVMIIDIRFIVQCFM
jgi:hypothetical protein